MQQSDSTDRLAHLFDGSVGTAMTLVFMFAFLGLGVFNIFYLITRRGVGRKREQS